MGNKPLIRLLCNELDGCLFSQLLSSFCFVYISLYCFYYCKLPSIIMELGGLIKHINKKWIVPYSPKAASTTTAITSKTTKTYNTFTDVCRVRFFSHWLQLVLIRPARDKVHMENLVYLGLSSASDFIHMTRIFEIYPKEKGLWEQRLHENRT